MPKSMSINSDSRVVGLAGHHNHLLVFVREGGVEADNVFICRYAVVVAPKYQDRTTDF